MIDIIASSSKGNAYKYFNILVDCGVPYCKLKKYLKEVNFIIFTHQHSDHLKIETVKRIVEEFPRIKFGIPTHLEELLHGVIPKERQISLERGLEYDFKHFKVQGVKLYHDVPNNGYLIEFKRVKGEYGNYKVFHATDTAHIKGIKIPRVDLIVLEKNYNREKCNKFLEETAYLDNLPYNENTKELKHRRKITINAMNSHLGDDQFNAFINWYLDFYGLNYDDVTVVEAHGSKERL